MSHSHPAACFAVILPAEGQPWEFSLYHTGACSEELTLGRKDRSRKGDAFPQLAASLQEITHSHTEYVYIQKSSQLVRLGA